VDGSRQKKQKEMTPMIPLLAELSGNLPVALVGFGAAIGVGMVASKAAEAIGRNPGAFGKIFLLALLGMAFAEGLAILVYFVVAK
jgi:F-type H+-transporting ATPase subunit c